MVKAHVEANCTKDFKSHRCGGCAGMVHKSSVKQTAGRTLSQVGKSDFSDSSVRFNTLLAWPQWILLASNLDLMVKVSAATPATVFKDSIKDSIAWQPAWD